MVNKPRSIGTNAETAVVRYLRTAGFPHAERRALRGTHDAGDITGTPGIAWEIKAGQAAKTASDGQITTWLHETMTERHHAGADYGILVLARSGVGHTNADRWWAIMDIASLLHLTDAHYVIQAPTAHVRIHLSTICQVLRTAGYGRENLRENVS